MVRVRLELPTVKIVGKLRYGAYQRECFEFCRTVTLMQEKFESILINIS